MESKKSSSVLSQIRRFLIPEYFLFIVGLILSIIGALSTLALPLIMGSLADRDRMNFIDSIRENIYQKLFNKGNTYHENT